MGWKLRCSSNTRRRIGRDVCKSIAPDESRPLCRLILMLRTASRRLALHKPHGSLKSLSDLFRCFVSLLRERKRRTKWLTRCAIAQIYSRLEARKLLCIQSWKSQRVNDRVEFRRFTPFQASVLSSRGRLLRVDLTVKRIEGSGLVYLRVCQGAQSDAEIEVEGEEVVELLCSKVPLWINTET